MFKMLNSKIAIAIISVVLSSALTLVINHKIAEYNNDNSKEIAKMQNDTSITIADNQAKANQENWGKQQRFLHDQDKLKSQREDLFKLREAFDQFEDTRRILFYSHLETLLMETKVDWNSPAEVQYYRKLVESRIQTEQGLNNTLINLRAANNTLIEKNLAYYDSLSIKNAYNNFYNQIYKSNQVMNIDQNELLNFYNIQFTKTSDTNRAYNITYNEYTERFNSNGVSTSFYKLYQALNEEKSKLVVAQQNL